MLAKLDEGPVKESEVLKIIKATLKEDSGAKQSVQVSTFIALNHTSTIVTFSGF